MRCLSKRIRNRCIMTFVNSLNHFRRQIPQMSRRVGLKTYIPREDAHLHTHTDVETSHGFTTTRTLTASTLLTDYIKWPGLAQVYRIPISAREYKNRRNHLSDAVWYHQPLARNRICRRLAQTPTRTLDDRKTRSIGSETPFSGRTLHKPERGTSHKSWQHYATQLCLSYDFTDIQKSLKQRDFSLQNLYSQLNLLCKES